MDAPQMKISATVIGGPDPRAVADFYEKLLGWTREQDEPDWVKLLPPDGRTGLSFQTEERHVPPIWPAGEGDQQMMMHLDIAVENLNDSVQWALEAGATLADLQPDLDNRVMLDPAGHPFCLFEN